MVSLSDRFDLTTPLSETGAISVHRIQSLFSLTGIDAVWTACQEQPWPGEVAIA